jgi:hypothetical protein
VLHPLRQSEENYKYSLSIDMFDQFDNDLLLKEQIQYFDELNFDISDIDNLKELRKVYLPK